MTLAEFRRIAIAKGQVGIMALGQSGFVLRFPDAQVLVDGYFSAHPDRLLEPPFRPDEAKGFDMIAFTHEHGDHMDLDAVPHLAQASPGARLIAPEPCVEMLTGAGIPRERITAIAAHEAVTLGGAEIVGVPARHAVAAGDPYTFGEEGAHGVRFLGYAFRGDGVSVYQAGDTLEYEGLAESLLTLHVDVALLPINGRDAERERKGIAGNMDAEEAADLAIRAGVDVVVPTHYDMFAANPGYPGRLVEAVRQRSNGPTVVTLSAGSCFIYTKLMIHARSERFVESTG